MTTCTICFSNVGGGTGTLPSLSQQITVQGLILNDVTFVSIDDLVAYLGATVSYSGDYCIITRNGQRTFLTLGDTVMTSQVSYGLWNYQSGGPSSYSFSWTTLLDEAPFLYASKKYVPAEVVSLQLGALIVGYVNGVLTIFDFRVNSSTPHTDSNTYIVGGNWIENWSTYSANKLSPNFKVGELWDKGASSGRYYRQLKISFSLLESLEAVRHYYRDDSSLSPSCAFRGWTYNKSINGDARSRHMRGRAFDVPSSAYGATLYEEIKTEFRAGNSADLHTGSALPKGFYRTQTTTGLSKGYEIETMPRDGVTWLHLQVKPGSGENP